MQKNFDEWNTIKKLTENGESRLYNVREIWWCRIGLNIGTEQNGNGRWHARPCIILKGFGAQSCLVAPITSSARKHPLRIPIGKLEEKEATVNLSQIRVMDTRRFENKLGVVDKETFARIRKAVKDML